MLFDVFSSGSLQSRDVFKKEVHKKGPPGFEIVDAEYKTVNRLADIGPEDTNISKMLISLVSTAVVILYSMVSVLCDFLMVFNPAIVYS